LADHAWARLHVHGYMESQTSRSLARSLCAGVGDLVVGSSQQDEHDTVAHYLHGTNFMGLSSSDASLCTGVLLCLFSLVVWFLTVIQELAATARVVSAVWCLPTVPTLGGHAEAVATEDGWRVERITTLRKVSMLLIQAARVAIALLLAYVGALFLVYEIEVQNIILNMLSDARDRTRGRVVAMKTHSVKLSIDTRSVRGRFSPNQRAVIRP
jgi:hypothetical protein